MNLIEFAEVTKNFESIPVGTTFTFIIPQGTWRQANIASETMHCTQTYKIPVVKQKEGFLEVSSYFDMIGRKSRFTISTNNEVENNFHVRRRERQPIATWLVNDTGDYIISYDASKITVEGDLGTSINNLKLLSRQIEKRRNDQVSNQEHVSAVTSVLSRPELASLIGDYLPSYTKNSSFTGHRHKSSRGGRRCRRATTRRRYRK
jgi:hypothetical protein